MAFTVTMPQLGETVTEGTILRWAKQPGDSIAEDEVLLEISTDKVDTEVPSPVAGVVQEILVPEGETVAVGTDLVVIGDAAVEPAAAPEPAVQPEPTPEPEPIQMAAATDEPIAPAAPAPAPAATAPAPAATAPAPAPAAAPAAVPAEPAPVAATAAGPQSGPGDGMRRVLSPVVRRLAAEHQLDLALVPGTGAGGRITRRDVEAFLASAVPAPAAATAAPVPEPVSSPIAASPVETPPAAPAAVQPVAVQPAAEQPAVTPPPPAAVEAPTGTPVEAPEGVTLLEGDQVFELDRIRSRIASNMIKAKQTAAHVWASVEVDFENVEHVRQAHKAEWKAREGFSLTYLPFVARAVVDALTEYPVVNSSIYPEQGKAVFHTSINMGIAVDLDQGGLVVGTVRGADGLRVVGLARAIRRVADKLRSGDIAPDDVSGSTFTITNPGPFGSYLTAPIINVPNTGILSTDTVTKRPVVVTDAYGNDSIAIRHIGYLGLSWDHRAFDGSTAVLFLQRIKQNIETWDWSQELA